MRIEEAQEKIASLFDHDARQIVTLFEGKPLCVVAGPYAIGKTRSLLPLVRQNLIQLGQEVVILDGQRYSPFNEAGFESIERELPKVRNGVLILDEAGVVSGDGDNKTREVLTFIHDRGYRLIPVIAYKYGDNDVRDQNVKCWLDAERKISRTDCNSYLLIPKLLDAVLAREFLTSDSGNGFTTNLEAVAVILEILPYKIHLLRQIYGARDAQSALQDIYSQMLPWFQYGAITREEYLKIDGDLDRYSF